MGYYIDKQKMHEITVSFKNRKDIKLKMYGMSDFHLITKCYNLKKKRHTLTKLNIHFYVTKGMTDPSWLI